MNSIIQFVIVAVFAAACMLAVVIAERKMEKSRARSKEKEDK